jgi:hypothetical protein
LDARSGARVEGGCEQRLIFGLEVSAT